MAICFLKNFIKLWTISNFSGGFVYLVNCLRQNNRSLDKEIERKREREGIREKERKGELRWERKRQRYRKKAKEKEKRNKEIIHKASVMNKNLQSKYMKKGDRNTEGECFIIEKIWHVCMYNVVQFSNYISEKKIQQNVFFTQRHTQGTELCLVPWVCLSAISTCNTGINYI